MKGSRHVEVSRNDDGDLVWYGHDLGPEVGSLREGATEYEFWRTVPAEHIPALVAALGGRIDDDAPTLVRQRFRSDVDLAKFAEDHGIPTTFYSWVSD